MIRPGKTFLPLYFFFLYFFVVRFLLREFFSLLLLFFDLSNSSDKVSPKLQINRMLCSIMSDHMQRSHCHS